MGAREHKGRKGQAVDNRHGKRKLFDTSGSITTSRPLGGTCTCRRCPSRSESDVGRLTRSTDFLNILNVHGSAGVRFCKDALLPRKVLQNPDWPARLVR